MDLKVGPVVALAYTWTLLLDPNSGTINSLLVSYGIIEKPINLLGQKYLIGKLTATVSKENYLFRPVL